MMQVQGTAKFGGRQRNKFSFDQSIDEEADDDDQILLSQCNIENLVPISPEKEMKMQCSRGRHEESCGSKSLSIFREAAAHEEGEGSSFNTRTGKWPSIPVSRFGSRRRQVALKRLSCMLATMTLLTGARHCRML